MRALAKDGDPAARLVLLDPAEKRIKRVLQPYPLDMPLEAVFYHKDVDSAVRLRAKDRLPTRQVVVSFSRGQARPGCVGEVFPTPLRPRAVAVLQVSALQPLEGALSAPRQLWGL